MERVKKIRAGDVRTASRLIRNIEDNIPEARPVIKSIFHHTGNAHIVGITGSPGAGKSTLVDGLIEWYRRKNKTVGVLAVDPTSPFTGGAILGDRIRMQRHAEDSAVFVRSLATRSALGGLSKAVGDAIHVLDAMGKELIMVETVGAGQQEVQVMYYTHTVVLVLVPGMGDEIQALKAGIMEIADIYVINKADRAGTNKLQRELMAMIDMSPMIRNQWRPPILTVDNAFEPVAFYKGIDELSTTIIKHYQHLIENNMISDRLRRRSLTELNDALQSCILDPIFDKLTIDGEMDQMIEKLLKKETDPFTLAEGVASKYVKVTSD
ncbi:MAG: methylmalonyl Co-A mutase-associated GTPase MeaB [Syntrophales bacterium]|jgi:LAO/AO transport system kinase|nr:methylmalonyl Co-A mutase-associated GTPase MeaB [Syntrophales bacterium]